MRLLILLALAANLFSEASIPAELCVDFRDCYWLVKDKEMFVPGEENSALIPLSPGRLEESKIYWKKKAYDIDSALIDKASKTVTIECELGKFVLTYRDERKREVTFTPKGSSVTKVFRTRGKDWND